MHLESLLQILAKTEGTSSNPYHACMQVPISCRLLLEFLPRSWLNCKPSVAPKSYLSIYSFDPRCIRPQSGFELEVVSICSIASLTGRIISLLYYLLRYAFLNCKQAPVQRLLLTRTSRNETRYLVSKRCPTGKIRNILLSSLDFAHKSAKDQRPVEFQYLPRQSLLLPFALSL